VHDHVQTLQQYAVWRADGIFIFQSFPKGAKKRKRLTHSEAFAMNTFKQTLLYNWNTVRWIRLLLGILLTFQAVALSDSFAGMVAAFFLFQALTNTGCCGAQGCAVPTKRAEVNEVNEITYEEIKNSVN